MVKVIDAMLVNRCLNERARERRSERGADFERVAGARASAFDGERRDRGETWQRTDDVGCERLGEEEERRERVRFQRIFANSLDVLKRVVSMQSLRSVKHYFEKIGTIRRRRFWIGFVRVEEGIDDGYDFVFQRITTSDNDSMILVSKLKCGIMKTSLTS